MFLLPLSTTSIRALVLLFDFYFGGKFQGSLLAKALSPVLLKVVLNLFAALTKGSCLPFWTGTRGVGLVDTRMPISWKSSYQGWNSEWSCSSLLGEFLLSLSSVLCDEINWRVVLIAQFVRLTLDSCLIGKDSGVGIQTWKCHAKVLV